MTDLQTRLMSAGLGLTGDDFDRHGEHHPDLYVRDRPGVWEWLQANYEFQGNMSRFMSEIPPHDEWIDIPFAG